MNAKDHCMHVAIKKGNRKLMVKLALLRNVEGGNLVYLANAYADIGAHMEPHHFAGYLSALSLEGFYKKTSDAAFGKIL